MAKIMLVEDDANLQSIYGDRLTAEGHSIISAGDGEEALSMAIREKPDLIVSDVMMPKISGFDMLDILRTTPETKDVKIIMMTALSQAEDKERADRLGADKYLVKSQVTLDDVARTVEEVLKDVKGAAAIEPAPAAESSASAPVTPAPTAAIDPLASAVSDVPDASSARSAEPVSAAPEPTTPPTDTPADEPAASVSAPDEPADDTPTVPAATTDEPAAAPDNTSGSTAASDPSAQSEQKDIATEQAEVSSRIEEFLAKNLPDTPVHGESNVETENTSSQPSDLPLPDLETEATPAPVTTPEPEATSEQEPSVKPFETSAENTPADEPAATEPAQEPGTEPEAQAPVIAPRPSVASPGNEPILGSSSADKKIISPIVPSADEPAKPHIMDLYHQEISNQETPPSSPPDITSGMPGSTSEPEPEATAAPAPEEPSEEHEEPNEHDTIAL